MKLLTLIKNLIFHQELSLERKVRFRKENGVVTNIPIDTKGLRLVWGEPYSEDAVYEITDEWDGWDYFGNGLYCRSGGRGVSLQRDMEHPESIVGFREAMDKFKKLEGL